MYNGNDIILLAEGRLVNLGCATGHLICNVKFIYKSSSCSRLSFGKIIKIMITRFIYLPKQLDEKVARLHLKKIGAELDVLREDQADYIGVDVNGPYKPEYYRY